MLTRALINRIINSKQNRHYVNIKSIQSSTSLPLKRGIIAIIFYAMIYPIVYQVLTKAILLSIITNDCPFIMLAILYATPYELSSKIIGWYDIISLLFWILSCLVSAEIIPEYHFLYNFTITLSWLWLIIDCLNENLQLIRQYPTSPSSHPNANKKVNKYRRRKPRYNTR